MECYLGAWTQLAQFLNSMGKGFSFVASDVSEKCGILQDKLSNDKINFATIDDMIKYEIKENLIQYKGKSSKPSPSGSRTLLRLHRALMFLKLFFDKIVGNLSDDKISQMCYDAYHASPMAPQHPWLLRKAVGVAVWALPGRKGFVKQLGQKDMKENEIYEHLTRCAKHMGIIYKQTEELYQKNKLMELP